MVTKKITKKDARTTPMIVARLVLAGEPQLRAFTGERQLTDGFQHRCLLRLFVLLPLML